MNGPLSILQTATSRRQLRKDFRQLGAGFWLRRGCDLTVWEMDTAGDKA